jgi:hypothetical protein
MPVEIERPKFLIDLLAEVDSFDETLFPPHDEVEKDETVKGTLSPWLKKACAYARYFYKQSKLMVVEREYHSAEDAAADQQIAEMKYKSDALMELVWACVRAELNLWAEPNVGIREEWKVIRSEVSDDNDGFKKFILSMMRGK